MRRIHACIVFLLTFHMAFAASGGNSVLMEFTSSVLIPKEIYVGDTAEFRCNLKTQLLLLPDGVEKETIEPDFSTESSNCSVIRLELNKSSGGYDLSVFFIPWITGNVNLPEIDLRLFPSVEEIVPENVSMNLKLPHVMVGSLATKLQETDLRPPAPPVLVPGTTYVVYAVIALCVVLLIFLVTLCIKFRRVAAFFHNVAWQIRSSRNIRKTQTQLRKLCRKSCSDTEFAAELEKIIRGYLEKRFAHPFMAATTSEVSMAFDVIFAGMLSSEQQEAVDNLCDVLRRCDYIRYAPHSELNPDERGQLADSVRLLVMFFEKGER